LDGTTNSILQGRTPASAYRDYKAADVWVQGTPGKWDILASYTLAFANGTVGDYFDGYGTNPRFDQYYDGPIPDDRRHTLKGTVSYRTAYGLTFGSVITYRTGTPLWESFNNNGDSPTSRYRSPRGTGFPINSANNAADFNDPSSWANLRNPDSINMGVLARYNVGQALGLKEYKAEITCYLVNANDTSEPFGYSSLYSTTATRNQFGYSTGRTSALQGEVILRFRNF
ncbi:MAG TPA: TonB-dependent receptor, partial [Myxococcales bacterium]